MLGCVDLFDEPFPMRGPFVWRKHIHTLVRAHGRYIYTHIPVGKNRSEYKQNKKKKKKRRRWMSAVVSNCFENKNEDIHF